MPSKDKPSCLALLALTTELETTLNCRPSSFCRRASASMKKIGGGAGAQSHYHARFDMLYRVFRDSLFVVHDSVLLSGIEMCQVLGAIDSLWAI